LYFNIHQQQQQQTINTQKHVRFRLQV
jgi:hypothetical protein